MIEHFISPICLFWWIAYYFRIVHEKYTGIWRHPRCKANPFDVCFGTAYTKDENDKRAVITYWKVWLRIRF